MGMFNLDQGVVKYSLFGYIEIDLAEINHFGVSSFDFYLVGFCTFE